MSDMLQRMRYMEQLYIKFGGDEQVLRWTAEDIEEHISAIERERKMQHGASAPDAYMMLRGSRRAGAPSRSGMEMAAPAPPAGDFKSNSPPIKHFQKRRPKHRVVRGTSEPGSDYSSDNSGSLPNSPRSVASNEKIRTQRDKSAFKLLKQPKSDRPSYSKTSAGSSKHR